MKSVDSFFIFFVFGYFDFVYGDGFFCFGLVYFGYGEGGRNGYDVRWYESLGVEIYVNVGY